MNSLLRLMIKPVLVAFINWQRGALHNPPYYSADDEAQAFLDSLRRIEE